jgi:hypothetical protein
LAEWGQDWSITFLIARQATGRHDVKTVLVLDSDVGFVFWCGCVLAGAGYLAIPALSVPVAIALVGRLNPRLDAVIVNPTLSGVPDFIGQLRHSQVDVRVIAAIDAEAEPEGWLPCIETVRFKPTVSSEGDAFAWLAALSGSSSDGAQVPI